MLAQKHQHDLLSTALIQQIGVIECLFEFNGIRMMLEDDRGEKHTLTDWVRYLYQYLNVTPYRIPWPLDEGPQYRYSVQLKRGVPPEDYHEAIMEVLVGGIALVKKVINLLGVSVALEYDGKQYTVDAFIDMIHQGEIKNASGVSHRELHHDHAR